MAVLKYSLLRLGVFAVVFYACLYLDIGAFTWAFALICGLLISWAVGYLFFNRLRLAAGEQLAGWFGGSGSRAPGRAGRRRAADHDDAAAEDAQAEEYHRAAGSTPAAHEPVETNDDETPRPGH